MRRSQRQKTRSHSAVRYRQLRLEALEDRRLFAFANVTVQWTDGSFASRPVPQAGAADITVRRSGDSLQLVNNPNQRVFYSAPLSQVSSVKFDGVAGASDILTIDQGFGGAFNLPGGLQYNGQAGDHDRFWYAGTSANDGISLAGTNLSVPGIQTRLNNVSYLGLAGHAGNDTFLVFGNQAGKRIDLLGFQGDDRYIIGSTNANILVDEQRFGSGVDTLNFASQTAGVKVDISLVDCRQQTIGSGNLLTLLGAIENLTGSNFDDILRGNPLANKIMGLNGNDRIDGGAGNDRIYGGAGNDGLYGDDGNDVVSGGDGNDEIQGGGGFNLLIGGNGRDTIVGDPGENLIVTGRTTYDSNDVALMAILAEWSSGNTLAQRKANISGGPGLSATRNNGNFFLKTSGTGATVFNDSVIDNVTRSAATDWVLANTGDTVQ